MSASNTGTVRATREEEALAEIGSTVIAGGAATLLCGIFLLLTVAGVTLEGIAAGLGRPNLLHGDSRLSFPAVSELQALWRQQGARAAAGRIRTADIEIQDRFDRESRLAALLRSPLQSLLARQLRFGNSQVLIGDEDWLFFRDDFDYLTGPPFLAPAALARRARGASRHPAVNPDPLPAILGLAADLRARGIGFVLVLVPTKLGIAWERFLGRKTRGGPEIANRSRAELLARLQSENVTVFDPAPLLRAMEIAGERPYMRFDSHWSPAGLDRAAAGLAAFLASRFDLGESMRFHRQARSFDRRADLADLLGLDPEKNPFLIEPLEIQTVDGPDHKPFNSRRSEGRVLLLGDSFSRLLIRNKRKGGDANFAAQLAFHLQRPVDMLAENDAGADFALRVDWLRQTHELDGRSVVVLEVAERALALGNWTPARLGAPQP
jgi:alginate O-acetyltransferase complex protein AlgJ